MSKKIREALDPIVSAFGEHSIMVDSYKVKYGQINMLLEDREESYMLIEEALKPHFPFYISDLDDPDEEPPEGYNPDTFITLNTHLVLPDENNGYINLIIGGKIKYTDFIKVCEGYLKYLESGDDEELRVHEAEYSEVVEENLDKNIKKIVELFNLLGAVTISSCEGRSFTGVGAGDAEIAFLYGNNIEFILDVLDEYFTIVNAENEVAPCGCVFKQEHGRDEIGLKYTEDGELVIARFGDGIDFKKLERILLAIFNIVALDQSQFNFMVNGELNELNGEGVINPPQIRELVKKLQSDIYNNEDRDNSFNLRVITEGNGLLLEPLNDWDEDAEHDLMIIDPHEYREFAQNIDIGDLTNPHKVYDMMKTLKQAGHL